MPALRLRTLLLLAILLAFAGLLVVALARYSALRRPLAGTWVAARPIPNTDVNPYGANFFLTHEVEPWKRERTVEMAQQASLGWAKEQFAWAEIEPQRKGEYVEPVSGDSSWAKFDQIVDLYRSHGLRVIARLDRAPEWARPPDTRAETPPADFDDYGDFVYEFVRHFRGRVQYIQIWNEPNIYPEWGEQAVDPASYARLLRIAYQRAKEADPNVYVLSAPLAVTLGEPHPEPGKWRSMPDLDFLQALYEAGAGDYFDILSANAFGFDLPPEDPPDPDGLNFRRVELQRQIMVAQGDENKAIWFNEYGWNAAPETYFRQTGQQYTPDEAAYYFRMVDVDFTPRRIYDALQDAAGPLFVASAGHFEETNPAVAVEPGWRGVIATAASGAALLESTTAGDSLTFTFRGHSVDLLARQGPQQGRLWVTLDGRNVAGLPTDEQGRSYLDLYAGSISMPGRKRGRSGYPSPASGRWGST